MTLLKLLKSHALNLRVTEERSGIYPGTLSRFSKGERKLSERSHKRVLNYLIKLNNELSEVIKQETK